MKKLLMFLGAFTGFALILPAQVQAQCGKCIMTSEDPYQAYCQRGPLAPPAQKDCRDEPDGSCWENSESCYDELAVEALELTLLGGPKLVATKITTMGALTASRTCSGIVVAFSLRPEAAEALRAQTDRLIV